jgi:hypothetical protein
MNMIWQILALSVIALTCVVAFRYGGTDERLAAIGFIVAVIASNMVSDSSYTHTEGGVLVVDVALFFGLLVLSLRSDRFWPMWAAAFQLVGTMVHFASMSQTGDFAWAYFVALIFWTYPVVIALLAGTWLEGRNRREWEMNAR